jgi:hypothetical protein
VVSSRVAAYLRPRSSATFVAAVSSIERRVTSISGQPFSAHSRFV